MPRAKAIKRAPPVQAERLAPAQLERVGAFVRSRREALGLSQGDIARTLGYKTTMSVSSIELGKESLAPARAFAWADVLEVRREAFYLFVTGQRETMATSGSPGTEDLLDDEAELIAYYRNLPVAYRRQLGDTARALAALARDEQQNRVVGDPPRAHPPAQRARASTSRGGTSR